MLRIRAFLNDPIIRHVVNYAVKESIKPYGNPNPFPDERIDIDDLEPVPKNLAEAKRSKYWNKWLEAQKAEMNSHYDRGTYSYIKRTHVPFW